MTELSLYTGESCKNDCKDPRSRLEYRFDQRRLPFDKYRSRWSLREEAQPARVPHRLGIPLLVQHRTHPTGGFGEVDPEKFIRRRYGGSKSVRDSRCRQCGRASTHQSLAIPSVHLTYFLKTRSASHRRAWFDERPAVANPVSFCDPTACIQPQMTVLVDTVPEWTRVRSSRTNELLSGNEPFGRSSHLAVKCRSVTFYKGLSVAASGRRKIGAS